MNQAIWNRVGNLIYQLWNEVLTKVSWNKAKVNLIILILNSLSLKRVLPIKNYKVNIIIVIV